MIWIALEGGEGSGKSTQARRVAGALGAVLTREPGGTPLGTRIRSMLLDGPGGGLAPTTEALLMAADRAQHIAEVVEPALASGRVVVSDRSAWSSLAYQGYGRGLDLATVRKVSDWAAGGRWPDLAILVDVPAGVARRRMVGRGRGPDRLEAEGAAFHERVREGFAALAGAEPAVWARVDGDDAEEKVTAAILAVIGARWPSLG